MAVKSSGEIVRRSGVILNNAAQDEAALLGTTADSEAAKGKTSLEGGSARMSIFILLSTFFSAAFIMYLVYRNFPELDEEEQKTIVIPKDMDDAKALGKVLSKYKDTYYVQCSGLGASFCYMLSYLVGRPVVHKYLTDRATKWSQQVDKHREHLINYIIFLRITPFLPNWFINITSPVINVPLGVFFVGTFLGVAPPSFVAIKAGTTLYQLTTAGEAVSWNSVFVLMILAIVSLLPVFFQKKLKQKFS
ncbi:transmembrane protein 41B isoform X2 [Cetorhinus maximus]